MSSIFSANYLFINEKIGRCGKVAKIFPVTGLGVFWIAFEYPGRHSEYTS